MFASTATIGQRIGLFCFLLVITNLPQAQVASYDFNSNAEDQLGGYHATVFGSPTFVNDEYISFVPGEYLSLPLAMSEAIDVSDSWQIQFRFKVEGDWRATEDEDAQIIVSSKYFDQREGGFDIMAREWGGQLQLITTFGDGVTYEPFGCPTCGGHVGLSEGKIDFVIDIDSGIWYDVKVKFIFGGELPYVQYEVNGTVSISYFDDKADPQAFRETINKQQFWVGADRENNFFIHEPEAPRMDLQVDYLSFWSPVPAGEPSKVGAVLQSLIDHMNSGSAEDGTTSDEGTLSEEEVDSLRRVFVQHWDDQSYASNKEVIWDYINTYAQYHEPIFNEWINAEAPQDFTAMETIQYLMEQWILDNQYGSETVEGMEGLRFEDHELFPGKVSGQAPRLTDQKFTINGDYQTIDGFMLNGQEEVIRPSGFYVPPGELVTITVPDAVVGKDVSLFVGAHNTNLTVTWHKFRRFPRIMTIYELDAKTITVANPFGGGIYIKVPDGSAYGPLEFEVSGAIKAPYYSTVEGFSSSLQDFQAELANQYVPWADIESPNMMATITLGMAATAVDIDSAIRIWDQSFDAVNTALGRPIERFRAEYFLIDRQNHHQGTAIPASYPMSFERLEEPYGASIEMPLRVERGRDWYNVPGEEFHNIIFHEQGHLHNMPTLLHEQETNVHIPATAVYSIVMGESIDSAMVYSNQQRINLDQSALDWMLIDNFYLGNRIGYRVESQERSWDEQAYQARGHAKYVEIANLFGWEALGKTMSPFYELQRQDPSWSPYGLEDDQYIDTASHALGFNMAPHFEFWGIIPSDELVEKLKDMPTSDVIKDRLIHFRSIVPANNEEFQELHAIMTSKLEPHHHVRYDEWKTSYDETHAKRITDRVDEILNKYYQIDALDYNQNPVITGLAGALYTDVNTSITLKLSDFIVQDPDNDFPDEFTLNVLDGDNYSVSGNTVTPDTDFLGELSIPVTVNDGLEDSEQYLAKVTVIPENERPVITGLAATLTMSEDASFALSLDDFLVEDGDHTYPDDFTLAVSDGDNYTLSGTTITPDTDFNGQLTVSLTVSDGIQDSEPFTFEIDVIAVNDPPIVLGPARLFVVDEEETMHFRADYFVVQDPDHEPGDYFIRILDGENYSVEDNNVTPAKDFYGQLTIALVANDGVDESDPFEFKIEVLPVNDTPVINGTVGSLTTEIDQPIILNLSDFNVTDPDNTYPDDFTLTVLEGTSYTVSATTVTPDPSFTGELSVPVTVNDGTAESAQYLAAINVHPPNDQPVITGQRKMSTKQNTPITFSLSDLIVEDSDHSYPDDFTYRLFDGENYTIEQLGDGTTTITPDLDFAGELMVPVTVNDGVEDSEQFILIIEVVAENVKPIITGVLETFTTLEDTPITLSLSAFSVTDPDNTYPDDFTLRVLEGDSYSATGTTITPAQDFNGTLTLSVVVNDGLDDSDAFSTILEVSPVNDAPIITGPVSPLTVEVDHSITLGLEDFNVTDPDNTYPDGFALTVLEGEHYTVSATTVTPDPSFTGELSVPITVNDGTAESAQYLAAINVHPPNDKPVITGQREMSTRQNTPIRFSLRDLTVEDSDHSYPGDFSYRLYEGENYTTELLGDGTSRITPALDFVGELMVPVTVNDGIQDSEQFILIIEVIGDNDKPVITGHRSELVVTEDTPFTLSLTDLEVEDADNTYPDDFTLRILEGDNYSFEGTTITPAQDFNGDLTVSVVVNDGVQDSEAYAVTIEISPVNDAPIITGLADALNTGIEMPITLTLTDFVVADPDNTYPDDFTLTVMEGDNYSLSGATVTPAEAFEGTLSVPVMVSDGTAMSEEFVASVEVAAITGVDDGFVKANFSIHPNPATDQVSVIKDQRVQEYHVYLYGPNGDLVFKAKSITEKVKRIDLRALSNGFYMLKVASEEGVGTFKVIKK